MSEKQRQFLTGAEVVVQACLDAGATQMYGYPITPGTEVLTGWINQVDKLEDKMYLQTEDEIAAGFAICGAVMGGKKAFTATAGPGTTLMQDAMSMADGMRLPFVAIIIQRGGPSSGTVIYSQQEVNLAIHGGNGEGMRLVYSPSNLEEMYELTRLTFNNAWKYRFPSVLLSDGFLMKTRQPVELNFEIENVEPTALVSPEVQKNIRNIYSFEEELRLELENQEKDFNKMAEEVTKSESYKVEDCDELIIAHGIVAGAVKEAIEELESQGKKVGLFRPITLSPFPKDELNKLAKQVKRLFVVESSMGQLRDLVKQNLDSKISIEIDGLYRPAVGIESEEIIKAINK
ncbi:MAG: ferredoxin oxidoreductase [Candidatus Magasanikbacteria bacterium]|jgi:2-oxoglutarate/2-oxoacid ferredoxin oxidoreductase subunit alpha|nr:ferredoxin oxidoreductase [Candidatus Magasanikbacteria bacterium]MBT4314589.1 ferredoxin oxidoreductase [Candidatus Magasanikbacteria bacterium]MBT4546778.1 ferredoxin oxidoreductase [Candidatus Magasanikbacteria bacterium]MBT6818787.1 ferredoxin oxidoreductase [Candidatus Magasanikbacteria bacterium]